MDDRALCGCTLSERYRLDVAIGSGGMGTVYRALDLATHLPVAVKVLAPVHTSDPVRCERFHREAQVGRSLHHARLVRTLDQGQDGELVYLVTELLTGATLASRLRAGRLDPRHAATVAHSIASALARIHRAGVVHRDVKPDNVFLLDSSDPADVKLLDLGVAHLRGEESLTATGDVLGTPAYLSPEQCRGERATPASDLYALGVTLYECLVGRLPFSGSAAQLVLRHVRTPAPGVRSAAPEVPDVLDALVAALLAKAPAQRPPDAEAVVRALGDWLGVGAVDVSAPRPERETLEARAREQRAEIAALEGALAAKRAALAQTEAQLRALSAER